MGGCVSIEGMYNKALGNSLKTYKIRKTEVTIISQKPLHSLSENLVIPLFELRVETEVNFIVDLAGMECEDSEKSSFGAELAKLIPGEVTTQLKAHSVAVVNLERFSQFPFNLSKIIFVLVEKSKNFAREVLPKVLNLIFSTAESRNMVELTIGRLNKVGTIGSNDTEISIQIAKELIKFLTTPNDKESQLRRIFFTSNSRQLDMELVNAMDTEMRKYLLLCSQQQLKGATTGAAQN